MSEQNNNNVTTDEILEFLKENMVMKEDFDGLKGEFGEFRKEIKGEIKEIRLILYEIQKELEEIRYRLDNLEKRTREDADALAKDVIELHRRLGIAEEVIKKLKANYSQV